MSYEQPETFAEDAKPVVIVLTDGDEGDALSDQNGGPPFHRLIDLVLDLGMVQSEKADGDAEGYLIGYPDTDARHEASLDTLQTQIMRWLTISDDPLAVFFRRFVRVWKQESHRQVEDDASVKLARRLWTLKCELSDDVYDRLTEGEDVPAGLAVLPEPLRTVALLMPEGSAGADTCAAIAAALAPLAADKAFGGVNLTVDADATAAAGTEADRQVKATANPEQ